MPLCAPVRFISAWFSFLAGGDISTRCQPKYGKPALCCAGGEAGCGCCVVYFAMPSLLFAVIIRPRAGAQLKCVGCCVPAPCDVEHCKPAARGLLSFFSLLGAFLLHAIKRNQADHLAAISACASLGLPLGKNRLRCSVLPPFASLPRRSPREVVGPSASSSRRWNYNAGAGLVHAFDSRRAVCELFASHNTQILACFPGQLDRLPFLKT